MMTEDFRDTISIVSDEGKRKWIYPRKPKGKFYSARTFVSIFLLAVLFGLPLIRIDGHPFMLLDITEGKFILFGALFTPQDFYIFGLTVIAIIIAIFFITAVFGRVFCGWICPQTIFMEMVFRKIEYFIEGDYKQQIALSSSDWNSTKIFKKFSKYIIFFAISFLIANTLLAYIIGTDKLWAIVTDTPANHIGGLTAILVFTSVFYFVFASFREQACILVCPYGRLQGVLLDKNSIVIAYDNVRGEPRKMIKKNEPSAGGDCIDCKMCVQVCPTGIDIRNGTQLECVNCTACIDACDKVMDKISRPRGLIRYDSMEGIKSSSGFKFTGRMTLYLVVLIVLVGSISFLYAGRKEAAIEILRTPGMLFQNQPDNKVSNLYNFKITNRRFEVLPVQMRLEGRDGEIKMVGSAVDVRPAEISEGSFFVILKKEDIKFSNTKLKIGVYSGDRLIDQIETSFVGPQN